MTEGGGGLNEVVTTIFIEYDNKDAISKTKFDQNVMKAQCIIVHDRQASGIH